MDSSQVTRVLIFLLCIGLSAFFSASETAFTSLRKAKLETKSKAGDEESGKTLRLHDKYENLLSTILIGNNLVNISASAVATLFFMQLNQNYGALLSTVITTFVLLIFSEITPKLIAKILPEKIAVKFTPFLSFVMAIFIPFVWLMSQWQNLVKKLIPEDVDSGISEDELLQYVDEAHKGGNLETEEHSLVKRAMEFDDYNVSTILIPRVDVIAVDLEDSDQDIIELFDEHGYSRLPVYEDTIDKVVGLIHEKDFFRYLRDKRDNNSDLSIKSIIKDILYIPGGVKLSEVLKLMQHDKIHMAAIIDEHGGLEGIVTMEDILEELVGEIWDESDEIEYEVRSINKGWGYEILGKTDIDKAFEILQLQEDEDSKSNTLGGFVVEKLDKMPEVGDSFIYDEYEFEVQNIDSNRVEKVSVKKIDDESQR